jgi:hypothetical protein
VIAEPPFVPEADHFTVALRFPDLAVTAAGGAGTGAYV